MTAKEEKILQCYPFRKLDPPVVIVEGFTVYDGNLGDEKGTPHKGIDYVRKKNGQFLSFDIFSAQDGIAFQGVSQSWGNFVNVRQEIGDIRLETIYIHLRDSHPKIPFFPKDKRKFIKGLPIKAGEWLGKAGVSGWTKGIIQFHFEMHRKDLKTGERKKIDPYGVYDRFSSGKYPQPGESLRGLRHYFTSDNPPFAQEK